MKNIAILFITLCLISCKKEAVYGPLKLKDGEKVELLVDHRYGGDKDILLKLPEKELAGASLVGFDQREPGYTYRIKAIFHNEENPPQDGPSYYFVFKDVISKAQYKGNESFEVQLIRSYIPGGPFIMLNKLADQYYFSNDIALTYANSTVQNSLEEIWQDVVEVRANWKNGQQPKWKSIKATVVHDPQKFGKAYLVQQLTFTQ
ncbi:MAG TPA: hypothetical protein VL088_05805 [Pedobacter sp.]|nr:hypothetical protein [Pedobacter sp.]